MTDPNMKYDLPRKNPEQTPVEYFRVVFDFHKSHLGEQTMTGAMSWFFFAIIAIIIYFILVFIGICLCLTIIGCILGFPILIIAFIFFIIAIIFALIGLLFLLLAIANSPRQNQAQGTP